MSRHLFTQEELAALCANPNTESASFSSVRFTDAFKAHVLTELRRGVTIREILTQAGYDPDVLGSSRMKSLCARIRADARIGILKELQDSGAS